jgi:glycosyltransferase involved in cell wall biosynthesis
MVQSEPVIGLGDHEPAGSDPLITIALPVRNNERTLARAIRSILAQSLASWELLVLDDGSTDSSVSVARRFEDERITVLTDGLELGVASRLNQALSLARGTYYARMDGDDVAYPERFTRQLAYMRAHPEVDLVGARILVFGFGEVPLGQREFPEVHEDICRHPTAGFPMAQPTFLGRTEFFRRFGYQPSKVRSEDQDLLLRAYSSAHFANVPDILLGYNEEQLDLGKFLHGRMHLVRSLIAEFGQRQGRWDLVLSGLLGQVAKGSVDIVAVGTGLRYRLLRHRAQPLPDVERKRWRTVRELVDGDSSPLAPPKIKVAHVTTIALSLHLLLLNQLVALRESGYEVTGIATSGPNATAIQEAGIRFLPVTMSRRLTPIRDLVSLWRLYRMFRREAFTIVHTHTPKAGLLGRLAARAAGTPVVVNTVHGFYFHDGTPPHRRRMYIYLEKIAALCCDCILSHNPEDVVTAVEAGICRPDKIRELGSGIDLKAFDPSRVDSAERGQLRAQLGIPVDALVVGFVGRLVAEKGLLELFEAAGQVLAQMPETKFLFVGATDFEKADALTPQSAREFGIADSCIFVGQRQDMPELYSLMDVFCLPSHREGFPRAPMEAATSGVPSVVTDIRGCRQTVVHEKTGLLVPVRDAQSLALALVRLLSNPEERDRMGAAARRLAVDQFDERDVFDKVLATYAVLLKERGLSTPVRPETCLGSVAGAQRGI